MTLAIKKFLSFSVIPTFCSNFTAKYIDLWEIAGNSSLRW